MRYQAALHSDRKLSSSSGQLCWLKISALERTRTSTPEATDPKSAAYTIPPLRLKYLLTCTFYNTMVKIVDQRLISKLTQQSSESQPKSTLSDQVFWKQTAFDANSRLKKKKIESFKNSYYNERHRVCKFCFRLLVFVSKADQAS